MTVIFLLILFYAVLSYWAAKVRTKLHVAAGDPESVWKFYWPLWWRMLWRGVLLAIVFAGLRALPGKDPQSAGAILGETLFICWCALPFALLLVCRSVLKRAQEEIHERDAKGWGPR